MSVANRSDADALFRVSEIFEKLGDSRSAFKCVAIGAGLNHGFSQTKLGYMYASGIGTKKDTKEAARWYVKAYRNGQVTAAFNLAMDKRDQGDRRSAIAWLRKAVEHNYGDAFVELAKLYKERAATRRRAIGLLQQALRLSQDDISDDAKDRAEGLLKTINRP